VKRVGETYSFARPLDAFLFTRYVQFFILGMDPGCHINVPTAIYGK